MSLYASHKSVPQPKRVAGAAEVGGCDRTSAMREQLHQLRTTLAAPMANTASDAAWESIGGLVRKTIAARTAEGAVAARCGRTLAKQLRLVRSPNGCGDQGVHLISMFDAGC